MSTSIITASWDALSAHEQQGLKLRLTYLHAVVENTCLLSTRTYVQFIVSRALALHELRLLNSLAIPAEVQAASRKAVQDNDSDWLGVVRSTLRDYKFGPPFALDPLQKLNLERIVGFSPSAVVAQMDAFSESLLKGLCTTAPYLIGFGRRRLIEFCKEQAKFSREPLFEDEFEQHVTQRIQYVNSLLEGRFQRHLDNPDKDGAWSTQSMYKRTCDPMYLYKALRPITSRARESLFIRLRLIGHRGEKYCSSHITDARLGQLKRIAQWMRDTFLIETGSDGLPLPACESSPAEPLTLADCAKSATHRFAKLYTFANAIEFIAAEEGLASGMLTITMPPMFHPNPMFGSRASKGSGRFQIADDGENSTEIYDGPMPDKTNRQLSETWKKVLRRLATLKIGITGLRVIEPHQDGCPHWHVWLNYQPQFQSRIIEIVMSEFPGGLRLKTSSSTAVFESADDFVKGNSLANPNGRSSTRLDFAVIDRSISSGASYLMKYLLKSFDTSQFNRNELTQGALDLLDEHTSDTFAGDAQAQGGGATKSMFSETTSPEVLQAYAMERSKLCSFTPPPGYMSEELKNSQRIDAYHGVWCLRAFDFFGLARCLGVWDVLRQLSSKPANPHLAKLWALARGSEQEGRIAAGSQIRGNAVEFIRALGSMRAVGFEPKGTYLKVGLLKSQKFNQYGDSIAPVIGLRLFEVKKTQVQSLYVNRSTGEVKTRNRSKWVKTELTQLVTKTRYWTLKQSTEARQAELKSTCVEKKRKDFNIAANELEVHTLTAAELAWYLGEIGKAQYNQQTQTPLATQESLAL